MDRMVQEQERGITITSAATTSLLERPPRSTSSTRPATSTSPSRSSARCACSTARSRCSTASPASSRRPRPCGARPTSTACPRMCFVNKMDRLGADFFAALDSHQGPPRAPTSPSSSCPIGAEGNYKGVVDLLDDEGPRLGRRGARRQVRRRRHPRRPAGPGRGVPPRAHRRRSRTTTTRSSRSTSATRRSPPTTCKRALRNATHRRTSVVPGAQRLGVQEQGRAAAARRGRRLPAVAARPAAGRRASTSKGNEELERKPTPTSRSPRWRSRS